MAVSNTVVKQLYTGNGATTTFAIPFAFIASQASAQVKVYKITTTDATKTPVLQVEGALQDYTLTPAYDPVSNPAGPANVVFNTAPTATQRVLVIREIPYTQVVSFISNTAALGANNLELAVDRIVLMVQQLYEQIGRAPTLLQYDDMVVNFDPSLPAVTADYILKINAAGTGFEFVSAASILSGTGAGIPAGGDTGDFLQKDSAADGDATWRTGAIVGYSARYAQNVNLAGLKETIDFIMQITYTAPTISLSASGSSTIREKGTAVTASTLTATITKRSDPIAQVRFYQNPSTLLDTQTSGGAIPNGGTSTYNWTGSFSDNTTFRAEVDDNGATGGPSTVSATSSFTFVYPYYYGSGAAGLSAANVALLTKSVITEDTDIIFSYTPSGSQVLYMAFPAAYGTLSSILDQNNFETIGDWTLRTENITGLDATAQSYRIYEYNNTPVAGTYPFRFIQ